MKCFLCHLPFRKNDPVYDVACEDGTINHFHRSCYYETRQGRMGFNPSKESTYQGVEDPFPGYEWMQQ